MMLTLKATSQFKKDYKRMKKRGQNMRLLQDVIACLLAEKPLDLSFRDHPLIGDYAGFRECHILPDWLLIYRYENEALYLILARTGTHSDLFK